MSSKEDRVADPVNYYNRPSDVENDTELSTTEKIILLHNWIDDINLRLKATEENMPGKQDEQLYFQEAKRLLEHYQQAQ
jgi:hypothetical protein